MKVGKTAGRAAWLSEQSLLIRIAAVALAVIGLLATVMSPFAPLLAQTASQLTDDEFQPPPQRLTGSVVFSGGTGLQAPEGADRLTIRIADVQVSGTLPGMQGATDAMIARLTRGRIRVSEIFEGAQALEEAYVEEGLVLARVVLPAQNLRDGGTLRIVVVDGFVEEVDTSAVPNEVLARIEQLTDRLIGQRSIQLQRLERQLLLAGDTYGVALGSALATGATPGGTVIVLQPKFRSLTGFVGFDNFVTGELGDISIDAGFELNSYFGRGEVFYGRASGYPGDPFGDRGYFTDTPRHRTLSFGAVAPLNADGLSLNLEVTESRTTPLGAAVDTTSTFRRASARLYYPWIRSTRKNVTSQLSFDLQSDTNDILLPGGGILPIYEDDLRILRFSTDAAWRTDDNAFVELGAVLSRGLDVLGARSLADAGAGTPLSRVGADAEFTKLEVSGRYRFAFSDDYSASLSGRAQHSFGDALVKSEQIGISTDRELSTFESGTITGDSGWVLRGEVARQSEATVAGYPLTLSPYVFAAAGAVHREAPEFGEAATVRAHSYGIGVDLTTVRDPQYSSGTLRLELGHGSRNDGGEDGTRISVAASFRF